ncbi:MAG: peptidyl-prolyl cis-trans isomerase [bacterium]|nr:peptidyl-prolyl cis-trans isomerase [bacterium]
MSANSLKLSAQEKTVILKLFSRRLQTHGVFWLLCWLGIAGALFIGCGQKKDHGEAGAPAARSRVSGKSAIVARLGDLELTGDELEAALDKLPKRRRDELRDKVARNLLEAKLFSRQAKKVGLDKSQVIMDEINKMTDETLARLYIIKYIDQEAEPSAEEVKRYYLEHKDQFVIPESVLIEHLVTQSLERAQELLDALKKGARLEDLARQKSICRCWKQGGKHDWLIRGRINQELEQAAFSLEPGKLSNIIKIGKEYQIMRLLDRRGQREVPFDEAKSSIRARLFWQKKTELIQKHYQEAKVVFYPAGEPLLASIGEEKIPEQILSSIMSRVSSEKEKNILREKWAHYFVETKVFSRAARKVHLEHDPEVAAEIERGKDQILSTAFQKSYIFDRIKISDQDIEDFYQSHPEEFQIPLKVRVKSIVVKTETEAKNLLSELQKGASFADLAMKKSIHPSASKGGEIGWFGRGEKDPALEKAAFALNIGELSGVIKTGEGYEIIKLVDKKGGEIKPFDKVRQAIKMKLTMQRVEEEKQRYGKITMLSYN